jgi:hypothetical protein
MRVIRWILPALAWILSIATARADFVTYTESATVTGMLGASSFANALVTLTSVQTPPGAGLCTGVPNCTVAGGPISFDVSGVGAGTFLAANNNLAQGVVVNQNGSGAAGMSVFRLPNGNVGDGILFTESAVFNTYNITESVGPITGRGNVDNFTFPTSAGSFILNSVVGNSTFTAVSTLAQPGGALTNPTTFTQSGIGQIVSTIGGLGSEASYEFAWLGGAFAATASVAGANPAGSYLFQLSEPGNPGTVIDREMLDGADGFSATINDALLAAGDYVIALLADNPNDPTLTIDFATPVNGTAGAAPVPEPTSLNLLALGLILMLLLRSRRMG